MSSSNGHIYFGMTEEYDWYIAARTHESAEELLSNLTDSPFVLGRLQDEAVLEAMLGPRMFHFTHAEWVKIYASQLPHLVRVEAQDD